MVMSLRDALERLVDLYRHGASLVLLFDYDGTLVPLAPDPTLAVLSDHTRERLVRLSQMPAVSVGVLSGRSLADLKNAVGVRGLYYAGTSGLEVDLCGEPILPPESDCAARVVAMAADRVRRAVCGSRGAWVEQKPLGLTVHYRGVEPDRIDELRTWVANAVQPFSGRLRLIEGRLALEVVPDLGWTKGSALMMIVAHVAADIVVPLYAGDDANDADAMIAATMLGGAALGVGPHAPPAAQYHLPDPAATGRYMETLLVLLATRRAQPTR